MLSELTYHPCDEPYRVVMQASFPTDKMFYVVAWRWSIADPQRKIFKLVALDGRAVICGAFEDHLIDVDYGNKSRRVIEDADLVLV